jgi:hypothetical protein
MTAVQTRAASSGIGRKRDRYLVDAILRHAGANGGKLTPEVAAAALDEVWTRGGKPAKPATAMEIIRKKLSDPNIRKAIGDIYQEVGGFTIVDAVKLHVEHIKGIEHDKIVRHKEGSDWVEEVERVQDKPNYGALKDYLNMTVPQPAKKLEISGGVGSAGFGAALVPPVAARALGPAVVEDAPTEAIDVEFAEGDDDEQG